MREFLFFMLFMVLLMFCLIFVGVLLCDICWYVFCMFDVLFKFYLFMCDEMEMFGMIVGDFFECIEEEFGLDVVW